jgi:hypothetical protein
VSRYGDPCEAVPRRLRTESDRYYPIRDLHHLLYILKLSDEAVEVIDVFAASKQVLEVSCSCDSIVFMGNEGVHKNTQHIFNLFFLTVLDAFVVSDYRSILFKLILNYFNLSHVVSFSSLHDQFHIILALF